MYFGEMGEQLKAIDAMHKFVWVNLISDMFSKMENAFMFGDLHLFINVINGVMIIHCEDILLLRRCMATYLNIAIHFNTLFASQGFFLIMPTILRCYSQRQTNRLFCQTVEYMCKQFYILHRKPFLLQMCGSIANLIDNNNNDLEINAMKIKAKYFFQLCNAMENMNNMSDPLDILALVDHPKPLKALDLCYRDDPNTFCLLTDVMASCVTVCAFAPDSRRSHQMLLVMHAVLPHFIEHLERETAKQNNAPSAVKHEINVYSTLCVEMKALVNSCEVLARGPTRTFDIVNSETKKTTTQWDQIDNSEMQKETFRRPRDTLLLLCATFIEKAGPRLKELTKLASALEHVKIPELMDHKCHVKLSDVALSLLKVAPYDLNTMGCVGLQNLLSVCKRMGETQQSLA
uniref:Protein unc-80 homolog n=1 Tax=Steinernema glaseri TaxID=37863 RepID=A0A1I8AAC8_9BILA